MYFVSKYLCVYLYTINSKNNIMEIKKSKKSDLEGYRGIFLLFGILVASLVIFVVFNQSTEDASVKVLDPYSNSNVDEELVVIRTETPERPKPPKPKQTDINNINVVNNGQKVKLFDFPEPPEETQFVEPVNWDDPDFTIPDETFLQGAIDVDPVFPNGEAALIEYIAKNVEYPDLAVENGIEGTVYVKFVVSKTGKVTDVQLFRGVDPLLDDEAVRVIKTLPDFKPGYNAGRPVNVSYFVPIVFRLK